MKLFLLISVLILNILFSLTCWANGFSYQKTKLPIKLQEKRQALPSNITKLVLNGKINYHISVGNTQKNWIKISGNKKVVAAVQTQFKKHQLIIGYNHSLVNQAFRPAAHPAQVYLQLKQLNQLRQTGQAKVNIVYFKPQNLSIYKWANASLHIKGKKTKLLKLTNNGTGSVFIGQIYSPKLIVKNYGSGQVVLSGNLIRLYYLDNFNPAGRITLTGVHTNFGDLAFENNGKIVLKGVMQLHKLYHNGSGRLTMYWVKSNHLFIQTAGRGTVVLAGVAKQINATASGYSHLDLRYLRANTVFIKTNQNAAAYIWVNQNLYALAENGSNIYYFSEPPYKTRIMRQAGSVLPFANIPNAILTFNAHNLFH